MTQNPRAAVEQAARYASLHLAPLAISHGQLPDGNFAFRAKTGAEGDFMENDYILANGWWYWRLAPMSELPSIHPDITAVLPARGDGADIAAFIAWQLADHARDVLMPDRFAGQPITDANRLEYVNSLLAADKDPAAAKIWWDAATTLLVLLTRRSIPSTDATAADARKYLGWLGIDGEDVPRDRGQPPRR